MNEIGSAAPTFEKNFRFQVKLNGITQNNSEVQYSMCPLYFVVLSVNSPYANFTLQEIESEDDSLDDEVDAAAEDEHEAGDAVPSEPAVQKAVAPLVPPKDTERQLSKKELKKKELEELDAVLAELGISHESSNATQDETNGT